MVYLVIGGVAFLAALGRGATTDSRGALRVVLTQPFGRILLCLIALGLVGYGVWRISMGIRDPEQRGGAGEKLARRAGYIVSGLVNLALALASASLALPGMIAAPGGSGGDGAQDWTATLMSQPFGRWLVALAGLAFIGIAITFAVRAFKATFERYLSREACTPAIRNLCRAGILARAVVFTVIGLFLLVAAWQADPSEARDSAMRSTPWGSSPSVPFS